MTKPEIKRLLSIVLAGYPHMQKSDLKHTGDLWQRVFRKTPYDVIEQALLKAMENSKYVPVVADLREAIEAVTQEKRQREQVAGAGSYKPHFSHANPKCRYCKDSGAAMQLRSDRDGLRYNGALVMYEQWARCFCPAGRARTDLEGWPVANMADFYDAPGAIFDTATEVLYEGEVFDD